MSPPPLTSVLGGCEWSATRYEVSWVQCRSERYVKKSKAIPVTGYGGL
jgi:hypothetical protein